MNNTEEKKYLASHSAAYQFGWLAHKTGIKFKQVVGSVRDMNAYKKGYYDCEEKRNED
jgi:hypothetical protein